MLLLSLRDSFRSADLMVKVAGDRLMIIDIYK